MKLRLAKKVLRNVSAGRMPRLHTHQEAFRRSVVTAARRTKSMARVNDCAWIIRDGHTWLNPDATLDVLRSTNWEQEPA